MVWIWMSIFAGNGDPADPNSLHHFSTAGARLNPYEQVRLRSIKACFAVHFDLLGGSLEFQIFSTKQVCPFDKIKILSTKRIHVKYEVE
jgi:hypothetical protein